MSKKFLTYSILLGLASSPAIACQISGEVRDQAGNLVTSGEVQIMGTQLRAPIKKDGSFSLQNLGQGQFELHVSSENFIHNTTIINVPENGIDDLVIKVKDASIEIFDVTASAFHASNLESSIPVGVLAGDDLNRRQASTLGDTLTNEVGVHSSAHGGVAGTPIIRGLSGPRVLIAQNGLDASDASRVGPDHQVATDSTSAQQIEVLRGPATLFYGSGAIGGVINVVDNRIPKYAETTGELSFSRNSNNAEEAVSGNLIKDINDFVFSAQGYYRDAQTYSVPGAAILEEHDDHDDEDEHDEHENESTVENTQYRSSGFSLGSSYLFDNGHIGFAVERQDSLYGVPGHGGHEEHEGEEEGEEEAVVLDMKQTRYQTQASYQPGSDTFSAINFAGAYTDYEHVEIENGAPGTSFQNQTTEMRVEALHRHWYDWRGGFSVHYKQSDFKAVGEEAFTPPSDTQTLGLGWIEEKHFGDYLLQMGARIERVKISAAELFSSDIELVSLEDDHLEEDHHEDEDHNHEHADLESIDVSFTPLSLSLGVVWDVTDGYNMSLSYARAERAPSAAELFSLGPHLGSGNYEIGAFYNIDEEGHIVQNQADLDVEASNNLDFSVRKFDGDIGFIFNLFYNHVDNYYYDANTAFIADFEHDHEEEADLEEEHVEEEGHEDGLPVLLFRNQDAKLYGAELQVNWQATDNLKLTTQADMVRARLDDESSSELPRTPPARLSIGAEYQTQDWYADVSVMHVFEQDKTAPLEASTDGYTMVDVNFSYYLPVQDYEFELFIKGRNLTDEFARVHTSYLRDQAPLPGRSVLLGARARF
ncbi:TonB-dependent receptor [Glaciecola sp. 1036]|uniref:TonB-dependent receptor n=1 Tax=Alteromonadaceae TaxID=72275 RepID=UPI003D071298